MTNFGRVDKNATHTLRYTQPQNLTQPSVRWPKRHLKRYCSNRCGTSGSLIPRRRILGPKNVEVEELPFRKTPVSENVHIEELPCRRILLSQKFRVKKFCFNFCWGTYFAELSFRGNSILKRFRINRGIQWRGTPKPQKLQHWRTSWSDNLMLKNFRIANHPYKLIICRISLSARISALFLVINLQCITV